MLLLHCTLLENPELARPVHNNTSASLTMPGTRQIHADQLLGNNKRSRSSGAPLTTTTIDRIHNVFYHPCLSMGYHDEENLIGGK